MFSVEKFIYKTPRRVNFRYFNEDGYRAVIELFWNCFRALKSRNLLFFGSLSDELDARERNYYWRHVELYTCIHLDA